MTNAIDAILHREDPAQPPSRARLALNALWSCKRRLGAWPNILSPKTFHEEIQRRKIFDSDPMIPLLADKRRAKEIVAEAIGADWLIPTLWHGKALPPLAERSWEMPFVVKANHGSGWNRFVRTPEEADWPAIEADCARWMSSWFGTRVGEWHYTRIDRELLVEPFIGGAAKPVDYKLFVFHGRHAFTEVVTDRDRGPRITVYDRDWRRIEATDGGYPVAAVDHSPPPSFGRMVDAAERLSREFDFARVDFYDIDGKPFFGEMTFYPGAGLDPFRPADFDKMALGLLRRR